MNTRRYIARHIGRGLIGLAVLGALLGSSVGWRMLPAPPATVELHAAQWSRNGEVVADLVRDDAAGAGRVHLPIDGTGVRWSTLFSTPRDATHRLYLSWDPGPDGLLFEILIDGERQPPPRDGWRPTSRHLVTDLGPRWLGTGEHLIEFIAREEVEDAQLVLRQLELRAPGE